MSLKHGLLGLLNYGPMTGYELDKAFKASLGFFWQAKTSQIYRELDAMERSGWLSSERIVQTEKPNKRVYALTDNGRKEFFRWLSSPQAGIADAMRVKNAYLMRIFFIGETSKEQAISLLSAYHDQCREAAAALRSVPDAITQYGAMVEDEEKTRYWKITALYGEEFYHAGLSWAEKAIALLEDNA